MIIGFSGRYVKIVLFLFIISIISGCATTTPTPPASNSLQAALTANEVNIQVFRGDANGQALQKFEIFNASTGDRVNLDESGRGVLRFGDRNEIDLFGNTDVTLNDAKLEPGGSIFLRLRQATGHTHFKLNPDAIVRISLETDDSTITTIEQGTEFTVCFSPGNLTCIAVREGSLEVISQGEKQIYRKGMATFYTPGQPPQPPICVHEDEYNAWLASMRGQEQVQTLGQLVKSWQTIPCAPGVELEATQVPPVESTPTPPEVLPPTEAPTGVPTGAPTETPPLPYTARITNIRINDNQRYVVDYETYGYTEQLPGMHVHFFFNTVPPEEAGAPGNGPWYVYGGPRPFREYSVSDRPHGATQMCILVANPDHSVQLNTGNCVDLPG